MNLKFRLVRLSIIDMDSDKYRGGHLGVGELAVEVCLPMCKQVTGACWFFCLRVGLRSIACCAGVGDGLTVEA